VALNTMRQNQTIYFRVVIGNSRPL